MLKKMIASFSFAMSMSGAMAQDISFGFISTEASQNLKADWQPLLDDLAKQTGLNVTPYFASDYAGMIEAMRFNKIQVAWMGNKSAMEAVDRANGEVFAQMVNADGSQGYYSHLIVHKDSPLKNLDDVFKEGKTLSFGHGDPNSTSGFLVPSFYVFAQNKVDPKKLFKVLRHANHETNVLAVANKQVDVATNNSENLEKIKARQPEKFDQIRVIWTSPMIALDPLVMSSKLPEETQTKLKNFFYHYAKTEPREKEIIMKISKLSGFKPSTNDQLKPIRQLELFVMRNKIEVDRNLSEKDKRAKLAEIDAQLVSLK
jgi:phosphonate transport system substrate-binding protein